MDGYYPRIQGFEASSGMLIIYRELWFGISPIVHIRGVYLPVNIIEMHLNKI